MLKSINKWLDKPMRYPAFYYLSIVASIFSYLLSTTLIHLYDTDTYFLIDTGREIMKNGFLYTNPWSIVENMGFICQQWLYCVIVAFMHNNFGGFGMFVLIASQVTLYCFLAYRFLRLKGITLGQSCIVIGALMIIGQSYTINSRPELITIIILLCLALSLEKYVASGKWYWLLSIPVLNLLEINLHSSMWVFHYAVIVAYLVPAFYMKGLIVKEPKYKKLPVAITAIASLPVLLINPYGMDGVMYVFMTYKMHTFRWVDIAELALPDILSGVGIGALIMFTILIVTLVFKCAKSTSVNMVLGFGLLMLLAIRNNMFLVLAGLYCFRDLFSLPRFQSLSIDWKKNLNNGVFLALLLMDFFFLGLFYNRFVYLDNTEHIEDSVAYAINMNTITDYLDEYAEDGVSIMTGFNSGAFLEYKGYRNLFIDARPECYGYLMTGGEYLLAEYSAHCEYGSYQVVDEHVPNSENYFVTEEDMEAWLAKYNFDYIIVMSGDDSYLQGYMQACDQYVLAPGSEEIVQQPWMVFERADRVAAK